MNETNKKFRFKITVIGDGAVGKTSLIQKFTNDNFKEEYIKTIGAQFLFVAKALRGFQI